jgi:hypothetical protein
VPNCKSFLVREAERKHVRQLAQFQQHRDASCHKVFFFPGRQGAERNSCHFDIKIGETCTIICHRQNWVAQTKRGDFSDCVAPCLGRRKTVNMPENIDQIHEPMLEDRRPDFI